MLLPDIDYVEIPVDWWNAEADKSLLIGVFKHGVYPALVGAGMWGNEHLCCWRQCCVSARATLHSHTGPG